MPKTLKSETQLKKSHGFYRAQPWQSRYQQNHSEIVAYVEASGEWETILTILPTSGAEHEAVAEFVLSLINEHQKKCDALHDAIDALELVLNDGLTFSSEQAAERVVARLRKAGL